MQTQAPIPENIREVEKMLVDLDEVCVQFEQIQVFVLPDHFKEKKSVDTFRKIMGIRLTKFVTAIKIYYAEKLLTQTECSVQEIANAVGFESYNSFSINFKIASCLPPKKYRARYRHSNEFSNLAKWFLISSQNLEH